MSIPPHSDPDQSLAMPDLSLAELQQLLDDESQFATRPQPGDWGFYLQLEKIGYFSWFGERSHMLRYLIHGEILHAPTSMPDRAAYDALVEQLRPIAAAWLADSDTAIACSAFNRIFPDFKIVWLGSFEKLREGSEPFSRHLLDAFGQDPLAEPEAFADFVENYGL